MSVSTITTASILVFGLLSGACCKHSVREEARSPSGDWTALVIVTDCGAISDYGTGVTLRRTRGWFARDKVVVGVIGSHSVGITWRDVRTLHVYLPGSAKERDFVDQKIVNRHDEVDGVHIEYTQL
jgi:hypothetical protein